MTGKSLALCALAAVAAAALASCGGPKGDLTFEQATARHVDAVFDGVARDALAPGLAKSAQETKISVSFSGAQASGSLVIDGSGSTDTSSGAATQQMALDVSGALATADGSGSGRATFDAFAAGPEAYFRLRSLAVTAPNFPQMAMMADLAKGPFLDKWVKMPEPSDLGQPDPFAAVRDAVSRDPRKAVDALREALKAHLPFVKTADLGFDAQAGDYAYAVEFSGSRLADALDDAMARLAGTGAQKLDAAARADLASLTGTGKLVINEREPEMGSLDLAFTGTGGLSGVKLAISRRDRSFALSAFPATGSGRLSVTLAGAEGKLEALGEDGKPVVTGAFTLKPRRGGADVAGTLTLNPDVPADLAVVTFSVTGDARPDGSVKLAVPEGAVPFQDLMGGILGANPAVDPDPGMGPDVPVDPATQGELETLMGKDAKAAVTPAPIAKPSLPARPRK